MAITSAYILLQAVFDVCGHSFLVVAFRRGIDTRIFQSCHSGTVLGIAFSALRYSVGY